MADQAKENKKEETKKDAKKNVSKNVEKLVNEIAKLSVMELSDLVNALQDKLGVTAAPVAQSAAPAGESAEAASDESGGGNLVMTGGGDNKIAVIKALRVINQNLTLMDAKKMTEETPAEIIKDGKPEEVKEAAEKLKAAGATVEIK